MIAGKQNKEQSFNPSIELIHVFYLNTDRQSVHNWSDHFS